jgi:nucleotide-binding universal stress UspA family protein
MSSVIVGVDGSETAAEAASAAARLAAGLQLDLRVVFAYPADTDRTEPAYGELTTQAAAERVANEVATTLRAQHPGLTVTGDAEPGKPAEALVSVAERAKADLIVIGNKRVQGVTRILGSIAVDVIRKAPCDVYIAHTHG